VNVNIRPATVVDTVLFPAIERSSGELFRSLPDLAWIADDDIMSAETHQRHLATGIVLSAFDNDCCVGFISAERFRSALHIWQMAVEISHQRQGIGKLLLTRLQQMAGELPVTLTTFRDVAWNAPFYAALGFETIAESELSDRLRKILQDEAAHGIPIDRRVAMRWAAR
jgi:GNAT superfamily N-acetyltransferase